MYNSLTFSSLAPTFSWNSKLRTVSSCKAINLGAERKANKNTNFYKVLSLESESVGVDEIKKAYRSMALRYHPDVCPPSSREECTRMFMELQRAYETLSDPALRRKHDSELRHGAGEDGRRRSEFSRDAWEAQLRQLRQRSEQREGAKRRR